RKTPELLVKLPAEVRRPEKVASSEPSFRMWILNACPCVRGGAASLVQVDADPAETLLVTQMPPLVLLATAAYRRFELFGSVATQSTGSPKSCSVCQVCPWFDENSTEPVPGSMIASVSRVLWYMSWTELVAP